MESGEHSSSPDLSGVTVSIVTRHPRADGRGSASTSSSPASPELHEGLLCRFSELYFHEWSSAVLGKGPRGQAAHADQLPSFPSVHQCDVQTLDLGRGGETVHLGFLLHASFRKSCLFSWFCCPAPPSLKKQGFLVKGYARFNPFDIKIAKLPSDFKLCSSLHSHQLFRIFPLC